MIRDKGVIVTHSGIPFNVKWPSYESINIEDIAHSLAFQCRFTGHCKEYYSVAQHSVYVCQQVLVTDNPFKIRLAALLHDAAEAYLGDVASPIKALLPDYSKYESIVQECIYKKYLGETYHLSSYARNLIKKADLEVLAAEKRDIMPEGEEWGVLQDVQPMKQKVLPHLSPEHAKEEFLSVFYELCKEA